MLTYQDLLKVPDNDGARMEFVKRVINEHKSSELYRTAVIAEDYSKHRNRTITEYQKMLYDVAGRLIPDVWSANYKMASRFFDRFITQENQYLLGNGITWGSEKTKARLGKDFDEQVQKLGKYALWGAVSFGFFNYDHLEGFSVTEFAPLNDEENGALMAGVRFWQVDASKPLRATLYEIDGYTDYIFNRRKTEPRDAVLREKRPYILKVKMTDADGLEIYDGENYPSFPIVPLWGNPNRQSELVGLREQIDCYDLIKSGYANNIDEASIVYWTLNASGMDDIDLAQFTKKLRELHAVATDDNVTATPNTISVPYEAREALLEKLRSDLYEDAMALDTKNIANGSTTATQIKAAYEPLNSKTDQYEYCVREFLMDILYIAGIEDEPTFTRSQLVNNQEELSLVVQSAQFLDEEYLTRKILNLLGDGDIADEVLNRISADELDRYTESDEEDENVTETGK